MTQHNEQEQAGDDVSRRDFFGKAGVCAFLGTMGLGAAGLIRSAVPSVLPDPSLSFKIGPPRDYPEGSLRKFPEENVLVFRDGEGMWAISTVCTHLGCIASFDPDRGRFACPCHGSVFDRDGKVTQGPAPRPLDWLKIATLPNGQLAVDRGSPVPLGTKFSV